MRDILLRERLEELQEAHPALLKVVYCVGSRWMNVHMGAKTQDHIPPPSPEGFASLRNAEIGWVNEDKIRRHGFAPSEDTRVFVCGLPGVYDKLCGPRSTAEVDPDSALGRLGYSREMVVKF